MMSDKTQDEHRAWIESLSDDERAALTLLDAWRASRATLVVTLPDRVYTDDNDYAQRAYIEGISECCAALEARGVTVISRKVGYE